MRLVLRLVLVLVALGLLTGGIGLLLPRDHRATSRLTLSAPGDTVWAVMRDLGALPTWWSEVTAMTRDTIEATPERWLQTTGFGTVRLTVVAERSATSFETELDAGDGAAFGGRWLHQLEVTPGGTVVTVTERGWVANPWYRVLMHVGGVHRTLDGYLRALAVRLGSDAEPEHVDG